MPALCGSLGPMVCLNGATCNETNGLCQNCPPGYRDDQTLFRGNENCGINETGIYFVYIFTVVAAVFVSMAALANALRKKRSKMRRVLFLVAIWNGLIPFYILAHWQEGMRYGIAAAVLYTVILLIVNVQVAMLTASVENFMALTCNYTQPERLTRSILRWNAWWLLNKVVFGLTMIIAVALGNDNAFNIGQMALSCSLLIEVSMNIFRGYRTDRRIIHGVKALHSDLKVSSMNPIVLEFAERVEKNKYIFPIYGVVAFGFGVAILVLFFIYQSSIPYQAVVWSFLVMTWPVIGLGPTLLLKTKLGVQMDRQTSKNAGDSTQVQHVPGRGTIIMVASDGAKEPQTDIASTNGQSNSFAKAS